MAQLIGWLRTFGNAGAVSNAALLSARRREDEFVVRSLARRLRHAPTDATTNAA